MDLKRTLKDEVYQEFMEFVGTRFNNNVDDALNALLSKALALYRPSIREKLALGNPPKNQRAFLFDLAETQFHNTTKDACLYIIDTFFKIQNNNKFNTLPLEEMSSLSKERQPKQIILTLTKSDKETTDMFLQYCEQHEMTKSMAFVHMINTAVNMRDKLKYGQD